MILHRALTVALFAICPALQAQHIALDADAISRLGLVFAAVAPPDNAAGARFPAHVIASPQMPSSLHAVHGGVLESWHVQPGQNVTEGDVVATIRSASALKLQQDWVAAREAAQQSAFELQRDQALLQQGIIAEQRLRESERRAREADFALRAAQSALAQSGYDASGLETLTDNSGEPGRYQVLAPFSGVIGQIDHNTGDMIGEGEALLALRDESLWLSAELPAALATRVIAGQSLRLADHDAALTLRIKDKAVDERTQTVGIQAEFSSSTSLMPGQIVTLLIPPLDSGIAVPADAVVRDGAQTVVYVRNNAGVERRTLQLQTLGANYLATEGLAAGDEVVVRGASLLKGITLGLGGE